ncbi:MAG: 4Fe-4S dicluster domain-containing protein [Anaerolineae bacterium]|nr:4Fe-4S dicluster domain-containing protein [Anaerolineae bacterium]
MGWLLPNTEVDLEFRRQVEALSGHNIADCYQCGKCTAGCPVAFAMDYPPNQIMRGVQLGMRDAVLSSGTIWLCASCETCSTRCPQDVDPAGVMDALRQIAYAEGIKSPEQAVPLFHRIFLGSVRQFGRVYELALVGFYNVFSGHYLKDVTMAPKMLLKGKLNLLPPKGGDVGGLKKMFDAARELEAERE